MADIQFSKANGDHVRIQLAHWPGQGVPLFCIHGLTANCRCWDLLAHTLTPTHTLTAMDLRGRGRSDQPETGYSLGHHVRDIYHVLKDISLPRPVLCGHSLGAYIAVAFAAAYPLMVRGLILFDGGGQLAEAQWERVAEAIKPALARLEKEHACFEDYVAPLKQLPVFQPWTPYFENYFRYEIEALPQGTVRSRVRLSHMAEERRNLEGEDMDRYYPAVRCPTLILRATDSLVIQGDQVLPEAAAAHMADRIEQARLVALPDTNHYTILFHPNTKRDQAIREFLQGVG